MAEALRRADWGWLFAGVFAYGAVEILGAIQWQLLLRIQGFRLPWLQATSIFFIGVFFTLFTPVLIAGDAMQILYVVAAVPAVKSRWRHKLFSALHLADTIAEIRDALRCYLASRRRTA